MTVKKRVGRIGMNWKRRLYKVCVTYISRLMLYYLVSAADKERSQYPVEEETVSRKRSSKHIQQASSSHKKRRKRWVDDGRIFTYMYMFPYDDYLTTSYLWDYYSSCYDGWFQY